MPDERKVTVEARWDNELVPAGRSSERNLLLDIIAPPKPEQSKEQSPINLALVIDRSGSMSGSRLEAARRAATGIVDALSERDQLSLITFDNNVNIVLSGRAMDAAGRSEAQQKIARLYPGGCTDLAGGWFAGARCAAELLDRGIYKNGHVLILSDGKANRGNCNPDELLEHARELAERGVKTSAVGIGADYSPLQLDALAEGGRGRLHDAESVADIIDVVLGELGELQSTTACDVQLKLTFPPACSIDLLTRSSVTRERGTYTVQLGDIVANASRPVGVRVDLPAFEQGERLPFTAEVTWRGSLDQQAEGRVVQETKLYVVPPQEADARAAHRDVVERVADLWEAVLAYRAMRRNERRDYAGARVLYSSSSASYKELVDDLPDSKERLDRLNVVQERVSEPWEGRSKRQAFALSKKAMLAERDLREKDQGDWHDHLDDDRK